MGKQATKTVERNKGNAGPSGVTASTVKGSKLPGLGPSDVFANCLRKIGLANFKRTGLTQKDLDNGIEMHR